MDKNRLFFLVQSTLKYNSFGFGIKLRSLVYRPFLKKMGNNVQIKDGVTIKYPSELELGDNCVVGEFSYLVAKSGLIIGDNVLIGAGSKIITSSHNFINKNITINRQGINYRKITIKEDCWLGFDVKIFGGTILEKGCVVGANTILKHVKTNPYEVLAGNPVRIIKRRK